MELNQRKRRYRKFLVLLLICNLFGIFYSLYKEMDKKIPNDISIFAGEKAAFDFSWPITVEMKEEYIDVINVQNSVADTTGLHFSMQEPFVISSQVQGEYEGKLKLFGFLDYKNITFHVIEEQNVMPSGEVAGLYVQCDGIMVLGSGVVEDARGRAREPAKELVKPGDYIEAVNDNPVTTIGEITEYMENLRENTVKITLRRTGRKKIVEIPCVKGKDGKYKLGIWIREDTQGIGTITYVTEENHFGALGHGISDADTGKLMEIRDGNVYHTKILKVIKGSSGNPGELVGMIDLSQAKSLAKLTKNTPLGIFGITDESGSLAYNREKALPVGRKQEIQKGKATILCQIGEKVEEYEIQIEEINVNSTDNKGMILTITDQKLLSKTGGIIQGMSGSPILQNGKCIGAVTHVLVKDAAKGYGTFLETMLLQE